MHQNDSVQRNGQQQSHAAQRRSILTTTRLVVTTWLPEDVDALHDLHSDPLTMRWVRKGRPETRSETQDLLATYRREQQARGWTKWRVADAGSGQLVGRAGFGVSGDGRELGYTLSRQRWGQGLATEVARALVQWHQDTAPEVPLAAIAAVDNVASQRVLDKAGFTPSGTITHNGMACVHYAWRQPLALDG
ncbi:GNAT family N-acetyltransferase [uncultured Jatrophihabitans sp.]|uniref:GNAT family N-acetyltransferase n=1 Tax=uncultured Jatrophihabitans sp. TaxID=1610747 RepID=UPI0035CC900A